MSNDMMTFPATVEEFMDRYKIVDVDQVYTNGAELVPIFRMKQWFEHSGDMVEVVRCKECKWRCHFTDGHIECRLIYDLKPVPRTYMRMRESDFCSYGERREVTEWD